MPTAERRRPRGRRLLAATSGATARQDFGCVTFLIPPIDRNSNGPIFSSGIFSWSSGFSISANGANVENVFGNALPTVIDVAVNATFVDGTFASRPRPRVTRQAVCGSEHNNF